MANKNDSDKTAKISFMISLSANCSIFHAYDKRHLPGPLTVLFLYLHIVMFFQMEPYIINLVICLFIVCHFAGDLLKSLLLLPSFQTHCMWKFLGQGSNPSCSCNNAGSFNQLLQAGKRTHAFTGTRATAGGFCAHCATGETPLLLFSCL